MEKFKIIYADPSWSFNNKNTGGSLKSGAANHYKTLSVAEMAELNVKGIAADDCILFMWWVGSQPLEAIRLAKAWGFEIKTMTGFVWVKTTKGIKKAEEIDLKLAFGMGFWTRGGAECCLIATKGKIKRMSASVRSVVMAPLEAHSQKPGIFRDQIVTLMGDLPRVELFARNETPGWKVFGDQVKNSIVLPPTKWDLMESL